MQDEQNSWIPAAKLLRPQGRRGELLAEPEVDPDVLQAGLRLRFGTAVALTTPADERQLQESWQPTGRNAGRVVLKLDAVDSISDAEKLEGVMLWLQVADLPPLEPDTFRVRDLTGCMLYDRERLVGEVIDLQFPVGADGRTRLHDAPDLLAVQPRTEQDTSEAPQDTSEAPQAPDPLLIPFVRAWVTEVDLPGKRILMTLPEGLLEGSPEP